MQRSLRTLTARLRRGDRILLLCLLAGLALFSCSDSGVHVAGGGVGGTGKSTGTITAKGSIVINGIEFDTAGAAITVDDSPATEEDLKVGMVARVRGTFNADGLTGDAEMIEAENEVQGRVAGQPGAYSFSLVGSTVFVDAETVYENDVGLGIGALSDGAAVEVHGYRDQDGNVRATRVELLDGAEVIDEVKGFATGFTDTETPFTLSNGAASITVVLAPGFSSNGTIANALLVALHGSYDGSNSTFTAARVDIEELEDAAFKPEKGDEFEVEGFVTGFVDLDTSFFVNGVQVQLASDVRFDGGLPADLANDVKIEAEGHVIDGGILLTDKIKFKDSFRIEAKVEEKGSDYVELLGKTVLVTGTTKIRVSGGFASIKVDDRLKVRGFVNPGSDVITATRIDDPRPAGPEKEVLQGPVESFDGDARSLVIIGITIDASLVAEENFTADGDQPLGAFDFFEFLEKATGIVVVRARGDYDGVRTITADSVEIE